MFSRIATAMRQSQAPTPIELAEVIRRSYNPAPTVVFLHSVANISHAVDERMVKDFPSGVTRFRQFKFFLQDGVPMFSCRVKPHGNT